MDFILPARDKKGHKGTFGTVAILGGSLEADKVMLGGPAFAAKAAIRSGVGMTVFIGEQKLLVHLIKLVPQAVGIKFAVGVKEANKWQSIVIGPGLGTNKNNVSLINKLLSLKLPTVIDADGLNLLAENPKLAADIHKDCVLTPHPKEFQRLAEVFKVENAAGLARKLGCTVVLKGSKTLVVHGAASWAMQSENPALATGGTGDVLAGLIAGLMAQYVPRSLTVFECAKFAVHIHAGAAEEWRQTHGSGGLIIEELLGLIPETMENMR